MTALVFLIAIVAFLLFGLATRRHHERAFGLLPMPGRVRVFRGVAWVALALNFILAIDGWGAVFGPIAWVGSIIVGAIIAFLALNLLPVGRPKRAKPVHSRHVPIPAKASTQSRRPK